MNQLDTQLMHPTEQINVIIGRIYRSGMTTTSGGNISIRDENGNIWITPSGVDKGSLTRRTSSASSRTARSAARTSRRPNCRSTRRSTRRARN
jgi:hypothetical protein